MQQDPPHALGPRPLPQCQGAMLPPPPPPLQSQPCGPLAGDSTVLHRLSAKPEAPPIRRSPTGTDVASTMGIQWRAHGLAAGDGTEAWCGRLASLGALWTRLLSQALPFLVHGARSPGHWLRWWDCKVGVGVDPEVRHRKKHTEKWSRAGVGGEGDTVPPEQTCHWRPPGHPRYRRLLRCTPGPPLP